MNIEKSFDLNDFDFSVKPQDDFYNFVNGGWINKNTLPETHSKYGIFDILHKKNQLKLHKIITHDNETLLYLLYNKYINIYKNNSSNKIYINYYINLINESNNKDDLWLLLSDFYKYGIINIFNFYSSGDAQNSKIEVPHLATSGLNLPDKSYYLDEKILNKYKLYIVNLWKLYFNKKSNLDDVISFEKEISNMTMDNVDRRNPQKTYNKFNINDFIKLSPFNWNKYFENITETKITYLIIDNPKFYQKFYILWNKTNLNTLKKYLINSLLINYSSYIDKYFYYLKFNFYGKYLSGQKKPKLLWERGVSVVNTYLGELLGINYVNKHFNIKSKNKMIELVNNLIETLRERIENLQWMSNQTKIKALNKLKKINCKIGYPDKWEKDYKLLNFTKEQNIIYIINKIYHFNFKYQIKNLYKNTNEYKWFMNPQDINAYYHPIRNEIVFPAGILQKPFFDINSDISVNYGSIGSIIGHELTHAFDDMGRQYDENGNLNNWWDEYSKMKFDKLSEYYINEYSKCKIENENINGKLTLGENIADHGGVKISYYTLLKVIKYDNVLISGFNPRQRFFISWANTWKQLISKEEQLKNIKIDPHSPNKLRTNITLANLPEFNTEFNIYPNDNMYRKNPIQLW